MLMYSGSVADNEDGENSTVIISSSGLENVESLAGGILHIYLILCLVRGYTRKVYTPTTYYVNVILFWDDRRLVVFASWIEYYAWWSLLHFIFMWTSKRLENFFINSRSRSHSASSCMDMNIFFFLLLSFYSREELLLHNFIRVHNSA